MAHFTKPAEGSWTEHFGLDTGPVSYSDSISPEHYELEREAIFKKTWLNVGRVEQLARNGSYFTREIDAAKTSIIVTKGTDGEIRAFHNICRHRGNKLVWQDFPQEETSGAVRQFTCKYHGWRYGLDGGCTFVQQESEFFDLDKSKLGLAAVRCEVWAGFIFINLDANATPLADYMDEMGASIADYPFEKFTQVFKYRAEIKANWKLFIDAFAEFYHAPVLHAKQAVNEESKKLQNVGYEALYYDVDGPHSMVSSWGGMSPPKDLDMVKPIERVLRSGLFGPWEGPELGDLEQIAPGLNPARHKAWGSDSFVFFPNFMVLIWKPGWYLTYHYWPTAYNSHIFEGTLYFVPPKTARERLGQELAAVTFKEYALQDGNTLEATQSMIEAGFVKEFPLGDQEVLLRHLHTTARRYVSDFQGGGGQLRPISAVS